ncbi:hypothetical protein J6590_037101 [Homalodisca vitripennis]|nr:hypothetical protein J6590_037101 [Homalodisca vitripennis]
MKQALINLTSSQISNYQALPTSLENDDLETSLTLAAEERKPIPQASTLSPMTTPLLLELTKMKVHQDHIEHLFNSFQEQLNDIKSNPATVTSATTKRLSYSYYNSPKVTKKNASRGKNRFSVSLQVAKAQAITHHNDKKETKGSYNQSTGTVH